MIPPLTGQYSLYLKRQIENFRQGDRLHDAAEDAQIFSEFGDAEIDDILAFLSVQDD
jgi:cytochrome c553